MTESGQLQPEETLDDRGVDDVLDEGYSPPEKLRGATAKGVTEHEQLEGETIEDRIAQEEPELEEEDIEQEDDPAPPGAVGDERAGRLADDEHLFAHDVGIDGGAASAEEAAVHLTDPPD